MYPRIVEIPLPFDIFGVDELTVYAYGMMVVIGVLAAAWLAARELDRMFREGRVSGVRVPVEEEGGEKRRKRRGRNRKSAMRTASPSVLMGTIATLAIVGGIVGAKLFYVLENLDRFAEAPFATVFSSGGLTFYGGFLVAAGAIIWFLRKHDLSVSDFADALAPGLMLAYGIGRIGCHLAGDGDWGIPSDLSLKPDWLPTWLWAETYPNAIIGSPAQPVYPTSIYEFIAAVGIFAALWAVRRHPYKGGWLFALYLVLSGVERFFIELIRVNPEYDLFGLTVTQAEVIAVLLVAAGLAGLALLSRRRDRAAEEAQAEKNREMIRQQNVASSAA